MPVEEDPSRGPAGRVLLDAAGTPIGRYDHALRGNGPIADLFAREPGVSVDRAAAAVLAELRGTRIAADEELGRALLAAGGTKVRHGHLYTYDFARRPPPRDWEAPPRVRLTDVDRPAADLVDAYGAAYPPAHPDHGLVTGDVADELAAIIERGQYGPLLAGSGLAVGEDGAVVGAVLIGTLEGGAPPSTARGSSTSSATPRGPGSAARSCSARSRWRTTSRSG